MPADMPPTVPPRPENHKSNGPDLAPGPLLYQAKYDLLPLKDTSFRYLIFSSQRTGSYYLCRRLCNVKGRFGLPCEYLHPKAIQMMAPRLVVGTVTREPTPLGKYLRGIERARTTGDGSFGIKVQPAQLNGVVGNNQKALMAFFDRFDRIVLLTRKDKLAQAISGVIAQKTGKWFNEGKEPILDSTISPALFKAITLNLARYLGEEQMIRSISKAIAKPMLCMEYEEIEQDGPTAFANLLDFLTGGSNIPFEEDDTFDVPEKPPGYFAEILRARFLDYISGR